MTCVLTMLIFDIFIFSIFLYVVGRRHEALAFPPPPLRGAGRSRRFLQTPASSCQTPKASCGHRPARRPLRAFAPWPPQAANFVDFRPTFRRSKTHQKSDSSKTLPKSQKSDPRAPKVKFLMDFGNILGTIFDQFFKLFQKTPTARFY